jgi:phosphoribosylamine--glycine ligase
MFGDKMDKVGVLTVCYGSRGTAIVDALLRSNNYSVELYIVDKNRNPFNLERAYKHVFIPDLDVNRIAKFAKKHRDRIAFGIVGPEKPIISGVRDLVEGEASIPMICPTGQYALEGSKVLQRRLIEEVRPELNPDFKVFDPKKYGSVASVKSYLWEWLEELDSKVAVKPDGTTAGKGVGVWGDHFTNREQLYEHFLSNYRYGPVIVEEKVIGEESSFQVFCDGKHIVPLPEIRDYKRAFEEDRGPNTGGMGSYKDTHDVLPFMTRRDREKEVEAVNLIFRRLKGRGSNPGLRGMPLYTAFINTGKGIKILEINSRPGDPELQNLLPILDEDFVDVCFKMVDGKLRDVVFKPQATVVTYKVPPTYGGRLEKFTGDDRVDLSSAYKLSERYVDKMKVYPGSMEFRDGETYGLKSRTVCVVGVADDIPAAREISLEGIRAIKGGSLWYRRDIASREHINRSIENMKKLRMGYVAQSD